MSPIRLVSWDLDGTLYPKRGLYWQLWKLFVSQALEGHARSAGQELHQLRHFHRQFSRRMGNTQVCREIFADLDRPAVQNLEFKWLSQALQNLRPTSAVMNRLNFFHGNGIRQVVLSNFRADYKVHALSLEPFFEKIWSCEEMEELKPSPLPFQIIQRFHGILPSQHLHIGDREDTDGDGARRAGCHYRDVRHLLGGL